MAISKFAAATLAFMTMVGFLWAPTDRDPISNAYFIVTAVGLTIFAAYPRPRLASWWLRVFLILVASISVLLTLPEMYQDLNLDGGADYPAIALRGLACLIFVVLIVEVLVWRSPKIAV